MPPFIFFCACLLLCFKKCLQSYAKLRGTKDSSSTQYQLAEEYLPLAYEEENWEIADWHQQHIENQEEWEKQVIANRE